MDDRALLASVRAVIGDDDIGDDCAVLHHGDRCLVLTTDMLHETTDFPEGMTDWQRGWMAAAVSLSDIASMGAEPLALLLAAGLDDPARLEAITRGASDCCRRHGGRLVGGDIDHHRELTLVSTALGEVAPEFLVRRTGTRAGDLVCVTGTPGRAMAGLEGWQEHRLALLEPCPRVAAGRAIGRAGATAMMDLSDGLALSLHDLAVVNRCGFRLRREVLPRPEAVPEPIATGYALYGGGDYELLFCIPADRLPIAGVDATVIGEVTADEGVILIDGVPVERRGYSHTWVV
ncbi:MAG TPA: thiamine-phosphate kinase [Methanoregulaceae archaeon]|nr:thiamine-phosphate kinase [Methanoregulaceae archaeon]HQJ87011.1 thiamine-phosphate kinase [Methanoregulaceae archaeon]